MTYTYPGHDPCAAGSQFRCGAEGVQLQHLFSERSLVAPAMMMMSAMAITLAGATASDENGSEWTGPCRYAQTWFRPTNRFPMRFFGTLVDEAPEGTSAMFMHTLLGYRLAAPILEGGERLGVTVTRGGDCSFDTGSLRAFLEAIRGPVWTTAAEVQHDPEWSRVDSLWRRGGLSFTRPVLVVRSTTRPADILGVAFVYRGPVGLNFSLLENRIELILQPALDRVRRAQVAAALLEECRVLVNSDLGERLPVAVAREDVQALRRLGMSPYRDYTQAIWLGSDGLSSAHESVRSLYGRALSRLPFAVPELPSAESLVSGGASS